MKFLWILLISVIYGGALGRTDKAYITLVLSLLDSWLNDYDSEDDTIDSEL